jgi:hypothetical protein
MYSVPSTVGLHLNSNTDPDRLFDGFKEGAWYDASDLSTMFQDYQGRTPVTATGQSVSLVLDKSQGLTVGPELCSGVGTAADYTTVSGAKNIAVVGDVVSFQAALTGGNRAIRNIFGPSFLSGVETHAWYEVKVEMRQSTGATGKTLRMDIYSASVVYLGSSNEVSSTGSFQEVSCIVNQTGASGYFLLYFNIVNPAIDDTVEIKNISVKKIEGNHCQQLTLTKAPLFQQDANSKYYLDFDGSDDFLQCPYSTIGAADGKGAYVCAGVTKDSDVSRGMIFGYNTTDDTTSNAFSLYAPSADGNADYGFQAKGSTSTVAVTAAATAPSTNVLTGLMSELGSYTKLRVNGVEQATDATSLGATALSSFRNFYIGGRQGTSLFFNGGLYSLIFVSSPPNFEKVTTAERYVNDKTQAY